MITIHVRLHPSNIFAVLLEISLLAGWFRFNPNRGTDYRVLVAISNTNKRGNNINIKSDPKESLLVINAFRELALLPYYIQMPMKR